jgi:valyl-tRNA synthetase
MAKELGKQYIPKDYEEGIYRRWEESGFFNPDNCPNIDKSKKPFAIVLPPPNVTGTLHMGHAAMLSIEDAMVRFARMQGRETLWVPGTDHAAIATEAKVEKMLIDGGMDRPKDVLGREAFLAKVNEFAHESHDIIINQTKRMGSSLDWSREAYTLDETRNKLVNMVFAKMYDDGLIYRGYRVVNWSVRGQSTCSDDELEYSEREAVLYTFRYDSEFPISIATTRPETKLGDTAVAVHPEGRWREHIGRVYTAHNVGGSGVDLEIKIIGSELVDDSFGTGALGVTPAHSLVDFDMFSAERAHGVDIGLIQVIGEDGRMMNSAGVSYAGLTVTEARAKFVEYLRTQNLLEGEEKTLQNVGSSDRFKDVVEPLPKTQWFIDVNKKFTLEKSMLTGIESGEEVTLKQLMRQVVDTSQIKILPARFEKIYFNWIDNLRDWNISRQIWFGHRVPVWYCAGLHPEDTSTNECNGIVVGDAPEKCAMCGASNFTRDPDTLDTWFSAGMWTFSTLLAHDLCEGESLSEWLARSEDFQRFHPTQMLETGYDIIFFWVARMILMTTYTLGQVPFETVYLHGLVRDEQGRKMSKTLGNIINPLDMIERFGTDATRLW